MLWITNVSVPRNTLQNWCTRICWSTQRIPLGTPHSHLVKCWWIGQCNYAAGIKATIMKQPFKVFTIWLFILRLHQFDTQVRDKLCRTTRLNKHTLRCTLHASRYRAPNFFTDKEEARTNGLPLCGLSSLQFTPQSSVAIRRLKLAFTLGQ
jgi:hypothetical protein